MYFNASSIQHITRKPSQLVTHIKQQQHTRRRAKQRKQFWLTFKAVLAATTVWAIGGALLGALLYITLLSMIVGQSIGAAL